MQKLQKNLFIILTIIFVSLTTKNVLADKNTHDAGWSSPVAREAHNLEVVGSNPTPAISRLQGPPWPLQPFSCAASCRVHGRPAIHGQGGLIFARPRAACQFW